MIRLGSLGSSAVLHAGILLLAGGWGLLSRSAQSSVTASAPTPLALDLHRDPAPERPAYSTTALPAALPVEEVELEIEREEPALEEPPAPRIAPERPAPRFDRPCRTAQAVPVSNEPAPLVETEEAPLEIHNPPPAYPAAARRRGEEGDVLIELRVLADGSTAEAKVVERLGSPLFEAAVLRAVARWRYRPAMLGSTPLESLHRVRFKFRLDD